MKCEMCNKNDATIHIQEVVNGRKSSLHICADCAKKKGMDDPVLKGMNLAEMLFGTLGGGDIPEEGEVADAERTGDRICRNCGWDMRRFRKTGRLGCSECYGVFGEIVEPMLSSMHRGTLHVGLRAGESPEADVDSGRGIMEIMALQKELEELILREEYEKAAFLRDRINELKDKSGFKSKKGE